MISRWSHGRDGGHGGQEVVSAWDLARHSLAIAKLDESHLVPNVRRANLSQKPNAQTSNLQATLD